MSYGITSSANAQGARGGSRVPGRTRPTPIGRSRAESGYDRVLLDVTCNSTLFDSISNPPVEIIPSPETFASSVEKPVGRTSAPRFDASDYLSQAGMRPQDHVDVIWHRDPGAEVVITGRRSIEQFFYNSFGDVGMIQPTRASGDGIQQLVGTRELSSFDSQEVGKCVPRERSGETPRQEVRRSVPFPVRETAVKLRHAKVVAGIGWILGLKARLAPRVHVTRTCGASRVCSHLSHHGG